jgi:hypothetical protein
MGRKVGCGSVICVLFYLGETAEIVSSESYAEGCYFIIIQMRFKTLHTPNGEQSYDWLSDDGICMTGLELVRR